MLDVKLRGMIKKVLALTFVFLLAPITLAANDEVMGVFSGSDVYIADAEDAIGGFVKRKMIVMQSRFESESDHRQKLYDLRKIVSRAARRKAPVQITRQESAKYFWIEEMPANTPLVDHQIPFKVNNRFLPFPLSLDVGALESDEAEASLAKVLRKLEQDSDENSKRLIEKYQEAAETTQKTVELTNETTELYKETAEGYKKMTEELRKINEEFKAMLDSLEADRTPGARDGSKRPD